MMRWFVLLTALLLACGSDDVGVAPGTDAGTPDGGRDAEADPWRTDPPAAPAFAPCPEGWREVTSPAGVTTCDPWPEGGRIACASPYEAHFPGEPGCAPIGSPCPAGDYSEMLPADARILYVKAGAVGGNGTIDQPFDTIARAMAIATTGTIVALAKGVYDEPIAIARPGVVVQGACAAETHVTASVTSETTPVIGIAAADVVVRDLSVGNSSRYGIAALGGHVTLEGVLVHDVRAVGILAIGGSASARTVVIRDVAVASFGLGGYGIHSQGDMGEATVALRRGVIERATESGAVAIDPAATLRLEDVAIRETRSLPSDGQYGIGFFGIESRVEASRVVLEDNRDDGAIIQRGTAALDWLVVRDTHGRASDGTDGRGLSVEIGADVVASHIVLERNDSLGLFVGDGATLHAEDVVVRDQEGEDATGLHGLGINLSSATMTGARILVENVREGGVYVHAGTLDVVDLTVRDVLPRRTDDLAGHGLAVAYGGRANVVRASIDRTHAVAVIASNLGSFVHLEQIAVRSTREEPASRLYGWALAVQTIATAEIVGGLFEGSREAGLYFAGSATGILDHVAVRGVAPRACAVDTCSDAPGGTAVVVTASSSVVLNDFLVTDAALCGVLLANAGMIDLHRGEISFAPIGACVQVSPYDAARLSDMVAYRNLGASIESTSLPVPDPATLDEIP